MKVSVIMAALNCEATIGQAIASFLEQEHADKELLVLDGLSQDRTVEIARRFESDDVQVFSERDTGLYDGMNKGLRRMTGDAFGCLNADDLFASPRSLGIVAAALDASDVVSGGLRFFRDSAPQCTVRVWKPKPFDKGAFRRGYTLPHPATYARRTVFDAVGEFSTSYRIASDYEWLIRTLELKGFRHSSVDDILVDMRMGGQSTDGLGALIYNSREMLKIRQQHLGSGQIDQALFLNLFFKIQQVFRARLSSY